MPQDLRDAFRSIRKHPGFTALAVLTLALGIGAATTIFSVIQNVLLKPFPYRDADRVAAIRIHNTDNSGPGGRTALQTAEFMDFVEQNHVFEEAIGGMPRFSLILFSVFAGVGLLLVAIGVYSIVAYTVSRQIHEIGIRMALGAQRLDVLAMIVRMTLRLVTMGVVLGLLGSLGVMRVLASQVWGISPHDPATLVSVVAAVSVAALAACYFPARRAMNVDPLVALRLE